MSLCVRPQALLCTLVAMTVGHLGLFLMDWGYRQPDPAFDAARWEAEERMALGDAQKIVDLRVGSGHLARVDAGLIVCLTDHGRAAVEDARLRRRALVPRRDYTRTEFVLWLYNRRYVPPLPNRFLKSTRSIYMGERLSGGEVEAAARYLIAKELVEFTDWGLGTGDLLDPGLTVRGIDCAESGKSVSEFLTPPPAAPVFTQNNYGGTNAQGMSVVQNVEAPGTDLAGLITQLRALEPQVAQGPDREFSADVAALEDPEQRVSAWQRIKNALIQAGASVGSAEIIHLGDQLVHAIAGA